YTMPISASNANTSRHEPKPSTWNPHESNPRGNSVIATRKQPYAPSFITTPASSIEAAVGAATWPVGAHVWNGHRPARIPNPTNTSGNAHIWKLTGRFAFASATNPVEWLPESAYAASNPIRTIADPTN